MRLHRNQCFLLEDQGGLGHLFLQEVLAFLLLLAFLAARVHQPYLEVPHFRLILGVLGDQTLLAFQGFHHSQEDPYPQVVQLALAICVIIW